MSFIIIGLLIIIIFLLMDIKNRLSKSEVKEIINRNREIRRKNKMND